MRPKPGCAGAVVELFERQGVVERALSVDGCHDVTMLVGDDEILVTASWSDRDAYQAWLDHPERNAAEEELSGLLLDPITSETIGGVYDIALAGANEATR